MNATPVPAASRVVGRRALAAAAPAVAGTFLILAFIGVEMAGSSLSSIRLANIAEAAGLGLGGEVLRRATLGEDPRRVQYVRPQIISSAITHVNALEAAVLARKVELVRMLDRRGFIDREESRRGLACLAADIAAADVAEYLTREDDPACEPGAARRILTMRSK